MLMEQEEKEACDASGPSYLCEVEGMWSLFLIPITLGIWSTQGSPKTFLPPPVNSF